MDRPAAATGCHELAQGLGKDQLGGGGIFLLCRRRRLDDLMGALEKSCDVK